LAESEEYTDKGGTYQFCFPKFFRSRTNSGLVNDLRQNASTDRTSF